jgi:hypothetical protein
MSGTVLRDAGGHPAREVCSTHARADRAFAPRLGGDGTRAIGYGGCRWPAVAGRAVGGSRRPRPTPPCCETWTHWWNQRRRAIPSRHSGGRARARGRWRWPWRDWGHHASHTVVAELLHALGYSLQSNVKTREGRQHPDRDAQFRYIAQAVRRGQRRRQPTISVDTKKKELVGDFKNGGRTWRPLKTPHRVRVHDFVIPASATRGGKAIPYGVYDLQRDEGWVSVGIDHDTASFAVHTIRRWWRVMGRPTYRRARSLLITADAGGSNGARLRLWKWELQRLATRTGLAITVCHFPPGTSKWNKIEHRLFSYIAMNWRGTHS